MLLLYFSLSKRTRFLHASCFVRKDGRHVRLGPTLVPKHNCLGVPIVNSLGTAIGSDSLKCESVVSVVRGDSSDSCFVDGSFVGQLSTAGGLGIGLDASVLSTK